jgi:hypothetical protein
MQVTNGKCQTSPSGYHEFEDVGLDFEPYIPQDICVWCGFSTSSSFKISTSSSNKTIHLTIEEKR